MSIRASILVLIMVSLVGLLMFFLVTNLTTPDDMPMISRTIAFGSIFLMITGVLSISLFFFNRLVTQESKYFYNLSKSIKHASTISLATIVIMFFNTIGMMGLIQGVLIYAIALLFNMYISFKTSTGIKN
jgi:hypothetical protein